MEEDFLSTMARLGHKVGVELLGELFGQKPTFDESAVGELVVMYSATQAACILRCLGLAKQIDEADFGRLAGYLADSTCALIHDLSGHHISLSAEVVPHASHICLSAYIDMRREAYRAR